MDAFVNRRETLGKLAVNLALPGKKRRGDLGPGGGRIVLHRLAAEERETEIDGVAEAFGGGRGVVHDKARKKRLEQTPRRDNAWFAKIHASLVTDWHGFQAVISCQRA